VIDLGKKKNKNKISFKTIHKDNKERKQIKLLNFAILFKKKNMKKKRKAEKKISSQIPN